MKEPGICFTRGFFLPGRQAPLEWAMAAHGRPKGLIFAPPLIGGRAAQQIRMYRPLIRSGYDLFSFSFSGHGTSEGRFSLAASIRDTGHALFHAAARARRRRIPLLAAASSYSAMPLLSTGRSGPPPFSLLVLINPLTRLSLPAMTRSFWRFSKREADRRPFGGKPGGMVKTYLDDLFPGVVKGAGGFGSLRRRRARLLHILAELFVHQPLSGVALADTPTLCLYGRHDDVLRIFHPNLHQDYERAIRRICPDTRFQVLSGGHFLRSRTVRTEMAESILSFISQKEPLLVRQTA